MSSAFKLFCVCLLVLLAFHGIPDSEDKAFVFEKDNNTLFSLSTIVNSLNISGNASTTNSKLFLFSEGANLNVLNCSFSIQSMHGVANYFVHDDYITNQSFVDKTLKCDDIEFSIAAIFGLKVVSLMVNKITNRIQYRQNQTLSAFTYRAAYLYTFEPLGLMKLDGCSFDDEHANSSTYFLKLWYDSNDADHVCSASVFIVDPVDVIFDPSKVSSASTTLTFATLAITTTSSALENDRATVESAAALSNAWIIVRISVSAVVIVAIIGGFVAYCYCKHMKTANIVETKKKPASMKRLGKKSDRQSPKHKPAQPKAPQHPPPVPASNVATPAPPPASRPPIPVDPPAPCSPIPVAPQPSIPKLQSPRKTQPAKTVPKTEQPQKANVLTNVVNIFRRAESPKTKPVVEVNPPLSEVSIQNIMITALPVDYHEGEPAVLATHICSVEEMMVDPQILINFWEFLGLKPRDGLYWRQMHIDDNNSKPHNVLDFMYLTVMPSAPFQKLANRILDTQPDHLEPRDGQPRMTVRIFIVSRVPLIIEVHAAGFCPRVVFEICNWICVGQLAKNFGRIHDMRSRTKHVMVCRLKTILSHRHYFTS